MSEEASKKPQDGVITLSRFRADLSRALQRRGNKLLEAPDVAAQMAELAPLEAYYIVKELGVDEAVPLLRHATPEQWQACIDLDCWEDDRFAATELDAWLAPFANEGKERLAETFLELDSEVQVMFLAQLLQVYDVRAEEAPEPSPEILNMTTMDGHFVLHAIPDRDREVEPFALVDALYRGNGEAAFGLLMAAKWELISEVEEQAYSFRAGRLADLGFPDPETASRLFAKPPSAPPEELLPPPAIHLPALYAHALHTDSLFTQALGEVRDAALLERLESECVLLVNSALVAYGETARDLQHSAEVAARVRDSLSLGLETLLQAKAPQAEITPAACAGLLAKWPLLNLFQHAHQTTLPLQRAAVQLKADPLVAAWLNRDIIAEDDPDTADRTFLAALATPRPLWGGSEPLRPQAKRAFSSLQEIAAAEKRLQALGQRLL